MELVEFIANYPQRASHIDAEAVLKEAVERFPEEASKLWFSEQITTVAWVYLIELVKSLIKVWIFATLLPLSAFFTLLTSSLNRQFLILLKKKKISTGLNSCYRDVRFCCQT